MLQGRAPWPTMRRTSQADGRRHGREHPLACQDWANAKAAYRFLSNARVEESEILGGHFAATRTRCDATDGPILLLQDTTEFTFQRADVSAIGMT